MEQHEIEKLVKERFSTLPQKLKDAIRGADVAEKLRAITEKHRLHIDQGQSLENEAFLVMLGLVPIESFATNLAKSVRVPEGMAQEIARDVQHDVFLSIRELLKQFTDPETSEQKRTASVPSNDARPTGASGYTTDPYREPIE